MNESKTKKIHIVASALPNKSLLLVTLLQLISHYSHTPVWLSLFILVVCSIKYMSYKSNQVSIHFFIRMVLVGISTTVFILYYRTNFSVDMAAAFLFLACVLKILELRKKQDVYVFVMAMFYLSAVSFLFEQGIVYTLLQILIVSSCFYVLFVVQISDSSMSASQLVMLRLHAKSMFKMMAIAIPFVIILFLFFPRISPLWQMPIKTQVTKSGISTEMSPGDVSKLVKSAEPAFRVTFDAEIPNNASLYWRGLVLDHFNGRKWTQAGESNQFPNLNYVDAGHLHETEYPAYQVMLEPHQQKWVFALEGSQSASSNVIEAEMGIYRLKTEAIQPTRYQMEVPPQNESVSVDEIPTAYMLHHVDRINSYKKQDLQLPNARINPRTQEYIKGIKKLFSRDEQLIKYLLMEFRDEEFFYTLDPPVIGEHFVDEFIFDTKAGFCGHYAGSLAYMLRLAGIPARIAIGYQGGEFNRESNYLLVSQFDAHAWVEAFLPDKGWIRIDPTAMVSPLRISDGSRSSLANERAFSENNTFAAAAMRYGALNWIRLRFDEVNFQWQNLVVNYNQDQQKDFVIKVLGENSLLRIALLFVYIFISFFLLMLSYLWFKRLSGYTREEKKYMIWLFILSKFGIKRVKGETPRLFLKRLQQTKYKKLAEITAIRTQKLEERQYRGH